MRRQNSRPGEPLRPPNLYILCTDPMSSARATVSGPEVPNHHTEQRNTFAPAPILAAKLAGPQEKAAIWREKKPYFPGKAGPAKLPTLKLAVTPPISSLECDSHYTHPVPTPPPRDGDTCLVSQTPGILDPGPLWGPGSLFYHTICKRIRGFDLDRGTLALARCFPRNVMSNLAAFRNLPIRPRSLMNHVPCISYGRPGIEPVLSFA